MTSASSITSQGVQDLIDRRLERLPQPCRPLLELAALMGRRLDLPILAALEPQTDMNGWLMACAQAALLDVQDQVWQFKHDKIREGIVSRIPRDRRVDVTAASLAPSSSTPPDPASQCVELMHHWGEGDMPQKELDTAKAAIQQAIGKNAITEAVQYLKRAIVLTRGLPEGPARDADELGLQLSSAASWSRPRGSARPTFSTLSTTLTGSAKIWATTARWFRSTGASGASSRFESNWSARCSSGTRSPGSARPPVQRTSSVSEDLQAAAQFWRGELQGLERPIEDFLAGLDRTNGQLFAIAPQEDPEVQALSYLAWLLWLRGRPDEAEEKSDQAIAVAQTLERRDHLAFALGFAAQYSAYRRDFKRASLLADASITLAERHGFPFWLAAARTLRGR